MSILHVFSGVRPLFPVEIIVIGRIDGVDPKDNRFPPQMPKLTHHGHLYGFNCLGREALPFVLLFVCFFLDYVLFHFLLSRLKIMGPDVFAFFVCVPTSDRPPDMSTYDMLFGHDKDL
jgi:hypothetical protein